MEKCRYCNKECRLYGLKNHELYCTSNPDRKNRSGSNNPNFGKNGGNQHTRAKKEGIIVFVSDETRKKMSEASKGRRYTDEEKRKRSETMQKVVREKPESYSASNVNGRSKKIFYNNVWLDSKWEFEFAKWCDDKGINWIRNTNGFEYEWLGKRIYYPDFYLTDLDIYVEVKGYERDRDREKWKSIQNLIIIKKADIKKIKSGKFNISACSSVG
jgi:hypothetical protein